ENIRTPGTFSLREAPLAQCCGPFGCNPGFPPVAKEMSVHHLIRLALPALLLAVAAAPASAAGPRQLYSPCEMHENGYLYSVYHFRPDAQQEKYDWHQAIVYAKQPRYVYFYNPAAEKFWGRFDRLTGGCSVLPDRDQADRVSAIAPVAFRKPG